MIESPRCRVCDEAVIGRTIPVLLAGQRREDFFLCESCWTLLERGFRRMAPDGAPEPFLEGSTVRLTEPELLSLIDVGLQPDVDLPVGPEARRGPGRPHLVCTELHEIGADLEEAMAASAGGNWAGTLKAVRMIQGRAVIARRALEGMLGAYPTTADLPPLVRAVQAVMGMVSDRDVDTLAPDELRAQMHAVLRALDDELRVFLQTPEERIPGFRDRDDPRGDTVPERP